jgi:hypothetical protein
MIETTIVSDHALKNHSGFGVTLTDSDLIHRVAKLGKEIASAFLPEFSSEDILQMVKETLLDEEYQTPECIAEWLDDYSDGEAFVVTKQFPYQTGYCYYGKGWHNWNDGAIPCDQVEVVLRKVERKNDTIFQILTTYPNCSYETVEEWKKNH